MTCMGTSGVSGIKIMTRGPIVRQSTKIQRNKQKVLDDEFHASFNLYFSFQYYLREVFKPRWSLP